MDHGVDDSPESDEGQKPQRLIKEMSEILVPEATQLAKISPAWEEGCALPCGLESLFGLTFQEAVRLHCNPWNVQ